jgi:2-dehydropantoate 2-reductase
VQRDGERDGGEHAGNLPGRATPFGDALDRRVILPEHCARPRPGRAPRDAAHGARPSTVEVFVDPFRIVVIGAGAVGGVFGGRLARTGRTVTFVARGATLEALHRDGLVVRAFDGDFAVTPVHAVATPDAAGPADVVLVAVKAEQVAAIAPALRPLLHDGTLVLPMQNGVDASDELAAVLGPAHVLDGFCGVLAAQEGPGRIHHAGIVPRLVFAPRADAPATTRAHPLLARLRDAVLAAGMEVDVPDDARLGTWEKLLFVSPLGSVGAAARASFGELLGTPATRALLERCTREIVALANASGVPLGEREHARVWKRYEAMPAGGTTSMQRDLVAGRPSELEAQVGTIVRRAARAGVPVPAHETLYAALLPQERRARAVSDA